VICFIIKFEHEKIDKKEPKENEKNLSLSILEEKRKNDEEFLAKGNGFPKEMISVAEQKLAGFNELKSDIDARMLGVHQTLDGIRQTIKDNIHSN